MTREEAAFIQQSEIIAWLQEENESLKKENESLKQLLHGTKTKGTGVKKQVN